LRQQTGGAGRCVLEVHHRAFVRRQHLAPPRLAFGLVEDLARFVSIFTARGAMAALDSGTSDTQTNPPAMKAATMPSPWTLQASTRDERHDKNDAHTHGDEGRDKRVPDHLLRYAKVNGQLSRQCAGAGAHTGKLLHKLKHAVGVISLPLRENMSL
jgi:hypothetical protein